MQITHVGSERERQIPLISFVSSFSFLSDTEDTWSALLLLHKAQARATHCSLSNGFYGSMELSALPHLYPVVVWVVWTVVMAGEH